MCAYSDSFTDLKVLWNFVVCVFVWSLHITIHHCCCKVWFPPVYCFVLWMCFDSYHDLLSRLLDVSPFGIIYQQTSYLPSQTLDFHLMRVKSLCYTLLMHHTGSSNPDEIDDWKAVTLIDQNYYVYIYVCVDLFQHDTQNEYLPNIGIFKMTQLFWGNNVF